MWMVSGHPSDGSINVVLVNKDASNGIHASIDTGAPVVSASVVYLQGPSLGATTGETFAGAGISAQGVWTPKPPFALTSTGNTTEVLVPPASAALVLVR